MKELLIKQIKFENWANTILLESMKTAKPLDERSLLLFSHILSASRMWIDRVNARELTTTLFQERTLQECEELFKANTKDWLSYLEKADDKEMNRIIDFIFPIDGGKRRMSVSDAILHIVHHSSYHRGQIVARLKGSVDPLPFITYIVYASEIVS